MRIVSQIKMRLAGNFDDFLRRKSSSFHFPNIQNFYLLPMQAKSASSRLNEVSKVQKEFRILNRPFKLYLILFAHQSFPRESNSHDYAGSVTVKNDRSIVLSVFFRVTG